MMGRKIEITVKILVGKEETASRKGFGKTLKYSIFCHN